MQVDFSTLGPLEWSLLCIAALYLFGLTGRDSVQMRLASQSELRRRRYFLLDAVNGLLAGVITGLVGSAEVAGWIITLATTFVVGAVLWARFRRRDGSRRPGSWDVVAFSVLLVTWGMTADASLRYWGGM